MKALHTLCLLVYLLSDSVICDYNYREHLDITPLRTSLLLASFQFWSNTSLSSYEQQHFRHIPRSLGQILQHSKTQELHLRFSSGRWNDDNWGVRPNNGRNEGGTGVEVWAWVEAESKEDSFARWTTLNHALSGLFCASLNFVDSTRTTRPRITFEPEGTNSTPGHGKNLYLLHGSLPREVVCTENLTPFLKLLPCKGNAGIASLLDGHKLFDASWQSMAIDVAPMCKDDGSGCTIEMKQTVDMVLDTERSKRPQDNPIPRPQNRQGLLCNDTKTYGDDSCFPAELKRGQSWTIAEIFGSPVLGSCLGDDESGVAREAICLHVPDERETVTPTETEEFKTEDKRCYNLLPGENFELILSHIGPQTFLSHSEPGLYASRSIVGHGQERGGIQTILTNPSTSSSVDFVYFESLPWFMKPYLHTLKARLSTSPEANPTLVKEVFFRPEQDRLRGTQLELIVSVPANSTIFLTYDFEKAILRYTEYPPDANRGFDVAPAVIRLLSENQEPIFLRTTSLLLPLPTPDFSMPYNVIILTSTVIALAFGSIFNILVRRFVLADEVEDYDIRGFKARLKGKLVLLKSRFLGSGLEKKNQ